MTRLEAICAALKGRGLRRQIRKSRVRGALLVGSAGCSSKQMDPPRPNLYETWQGVHR
ncbi:MAG: hypothetical protein KKE57_04415 [Proteobacteria bacterium]|nr:hypothetical protein [Pseudomonadota bacterium]